MTRTRLLPVLLLSATFAFAQRGQIPQQLVFSPYHASGIYDVGETVGWTVTPGPVAPTYAYKWTIRRNNAVLLKEGKLDLSSGKDKIEITGDQPEMIYVTVEAYADLAGETPEAAAAAPPAAQAPAGPGRGAPSRFVGGNAGLNTGFYAVGAAVAPERIGLSTPRPDDFDAFWDAKLAAQAKIPINPALTPVETDVPGIELSMFVLDALGSKAQGYLAKPARDGKFPALIQLQYAGVYALNARGNAQRAAEGWLVINVDSHDKLPSDPAGNIPRDYQSVWQQRSREIVFPEHVPARLAGPGLPVDAARLGRQDDRTDRGQHGRPTESRVGRPATREDHRRAGLRASRSGYQWRPSRPQSGYPNRPSTNPDVMKTALYFDTVNFASRIKAAVMAGMGFIDTISPPAGVWTALNQIPVPKEPLPMIESEHDNLTPQQGRACPARTREILDLVIKGGEFKPNGIKP
jgi:cephalosporin-C deacetylase